MWWIAAIISLKQKNWNSLILEFKFNANINKQISLPGMEKARIICIQIQGHTQIARLELPYQFLQKNRRVGAN